MNMLAPMKHVAYFLSEILTFIVFDSVTDNLKNFSRNLIQVLCFWDVASTTEQGYKGLSKSSIDF